MRFGKRNNLYYESKIRSLESQLSTLRVEKSILERAPVIQYYKRINMKVLMYENAELGIFSGTPAVVIGEIQVYTPTIRHSYYEDSIPVPGQDHCHTRYIIQLKNRTIVVGSNVKWRAR